MQVVDASCLYHAVTGGERAERVRQLMAPDGELASPHVIDVEVFGVIRRNLLAGQLDLTAASQAMEDLRDWPGKRFGHRLLLERAFQLRQDVRGWDAMYVALAEALDASLLTTDARLSRAPGPRCPVELVD
ncbi:MAG: type II toxin-antitoxin system VapC family toxin [Acidimicrobiales bacterium]